MANVDLEEMPNLPLIKIKVDFHFIESGGNNFQCSNPSGAYYAPTYALQILSGANSILGNPSQSNQTSAPDLPDTRMEFVMYDETTLCNSVFVHDDDPSTFSNENVLHVLIKDDGGACNGRGEACNYNLCDFVYLFNAHCHVFNQQTTDISFLGGVLCHEFGHTTGLCHSHDANNTCPELDAEDECGSASVGTSCSGGAPGCIWNTSNNIMSNGAQTGLVTSQWAQMYGALFIERPAHALFESCEEPYVGSPIEIESNTVETWDSPRFIETDIEIRSDATLIIECVLIMGANKRIIVNRGGRLFVNGGTISGQSQDCRWGGILVHGKNTVEQPEPEDARNIYHALTSDDAGVVWIKDSKIFWAQTAVSTKGTGTLSTHDYYGGLVMIDHSHFIDNGRALEFMRYNFSNKSYFDDGSVRLTDQSLTGQGISIWACLDLNFTDVMFEGLREFGIFGIDFNATIMGCTFDGSTNGTAIRSETTHPNAVLENTWIERCTLQNNLNDIIALSTSNHVNRFVIYRNEFENGAGNPLHGIYAMQLRGISIFSCIENNFTAANRRFVRVQATGPATNRIGCNYFGDHNYASILVNGNNEGLLIVGNEFHDTNVKSVSLEGLDSGTTSIAPMQGTEANAAGNCFDTPSSAIVANQSNTAMFDYFVHDLNSPETCEKPTNNLSDSGTNNYELENANAEFEGCDGLIGLEEEEEEEEEEYTNSDLTTARAATATKKTAYLSNPTSDPMKFDYLLAVAQQDAVLTYLVKRAFADDDLDKADSLMLSERNDHYRRGVVGLRIQRGDISGAESALDSIVGQSQDDEWFRDIMEINFKVAMSDTLYLLTETEEELMNEIAETEESTMSGYACALLSLCGGYSCDLGEETSSLQAPSLESHVSIQDDHIFSIHPNPGQGMFEISFSAENEVVVRIEVVDISGRPVLSRKYLIDKVLREQIEIKERGFYFIHVFKEGRIVQSEKIIVFK